MPTLAENKTAYFDYEILETIEAGLVLTGAEVKAARAGSINLKGSYVTFHNHEARLTNTHIGNYKYGIPHADYNPTHSRVLLLHRREVARLMAQAQEKGLTIVPLKVYTKGHLLKVSIGVARGRHLYDKRDVLKKRATDRDARQAFKKSDF
jgi:SsrA-binding protein